MRTTLILAVLFLLSACSNFQPKALDYASVQPESKRSPMKYAVYTPPDWTPDERLPLILFLHGGGGSHLSFERYGAHEYLDEEIRAGRVARAVIVTPDGDNGFWENWADNSRHYRDWVLADVVPAVQQRYNTGACPEYCHLAGISMGGFGALRMAYFAHPQFSSVSAISAPIYNREQVGEQNSSLLIRLLFPFERIFGDIESPALRKSAPYNAWVDDPRMRDIRLQLIWGDRDHERIIDANQAFQARLQEAGIEHDSFVYTGRHKWKYWVPNLARVMNFLLPAP